jgi:hypothetical protein
MPTLKGFVVESQIPSLTPNLSFDHNLFISTINEQSKGTSGNYILRPFQHILGAQIDVCLPFELRL